MVHRGVAHNDIIVITITIETSTNSWKRTVKWLATSSMIRQEHLVFPRPQVQPGNASRTCLRVPWHFFEGYKESVSRTS